MDSNELKQKVGIDDGIKNFLWILTSLGSVLGGLITVVGILRAIAAQQNGELVGGSMAAMGVGCAVIPYCLARAVSEMGKSRG